MEFKKNLNWFRLDFYVKLSLVFIVPLCRIGQCDSVDYYKAEKDLIDSLLDGYNPNIRPKRIINGSKWDSSNFRIHLALSLYSVMGIDEIEETMSTSMVFTIYWFDPKLSWDPAEHHNISQIYLKASEVWKPIWFVANAVERESETVVSKDWVPVYYSSNGRATWQDRLPLKTACDVDTTYYPFDKQSCSVLLQWYEFEIDVNLIGMKDHLKDYKENAMWELYNFSTHVQTTFPDCRVTYHFNRKPDHTIINVLFPVMLIALLGPLVFLLPAESGERTGYTITVLLSVSVYMIIISDQLPRSSSPMSLLTYVLFAWYVLCALIVLVVVICSKIYSFGTSKSVPKLTKLFVKLIHSKYRKKQRRREQANGLDESAPCVANGQENVEEKVLADDSITWVTVGRCIDKFALVLFYILKLSFVLIFAIVLNMNHF